MHVRRLLATLVVVGGVTLSLLGQTRPPVEGVGSGAQVSADRIGRLGTDWTPVAPAHVASGPVPRLHDGKPDLSGPWVGGGSNDNIEDDGGLGPGEFPLQPWAKQLRDSRRAENEPYLYCTPMGVPRSNPYPWRFVQAYSANGPTHIFVLHENGDAGGHRQIFMDGRPHPSDPVPTWFGHSIGSWEGDTLVIDTVGYNDKFWFDARGTPHTEQLHTVERWTRVNYGTLVNELTLDDPGAFSRPVQLKFSARALPPGYELMEFICAENNQYGIAGGIENVYREKGFGVERSAP
ncbi:MAG: hypothetical protein A3I61_18725 [Acidobacteria bacterium RIFCSPLOWO2_02_FULL_68_18]|nr:MAG: hypothetical protein A3I61_18725 [Acidobacteria bacterium RIFCSPLOWO2_02_FULL_68_18]OFW48079.1 MAG: hypothetical protein A3G77_11335 [Acidobacteria bacterium RIFCSPLOWO2_12_FULL_68_19]